MKALGKERGTGVEVEGTGEGVKGMKGSEEYENEKGEGHDRQENRRGKMNVNR